MAEQEYMQPTLSYMICATPRSGSTLLCEALQNTGLAGKPDEYFGPMHVPRWSKQWDTSNSSEYLHKVIESGSTKNGVFGVKIMKLYWRHFLNTLKQSDRWKDVEESHLVSSTFPNLHYIWITRRNKIRQAVSWSKAVQGVPWFWHEPEPYVAKRRLEFQFDVIDQFIAETIIHEAAWQEYFTKNDIEPYVVVYEDFVRSYQETTHSILNFLKIQTFPDMQFDGPRLKQQADTLSDDWIHLYQTQKEEEWTQKGWNRIGY